VWRYGLHGFQSAALVLSARARVTWTPQERWINATARKVRSDGVEEEPVPHEATNKSGIKHTI
jgi:hypothetical protein